jgi:hypothetical protein
MANNSVLSCKDSPLSIAGNVIGILTFVTAALLAYSAFFSNLKTVPMSLRSYGTEIELRVSMIERISNKLQSLENSDTRQFLDDILNDSMSLVRRAREVMLVLEGWDRDVSRNNWSSWSRRVKTTLIQREINKLLVDMRFNDSRLCLAMLEFLFQ